MGLFSKNRSGSRKKNTMRNTNREASKKREAASRAPAPINKAVVEPMPEEPAPSVPAPAVPVEEEQTVEEPAAEATVEEAPAVEEPAVEEPAAEAQVPEEEAVADGAKAVFYYFKQIAAIPHGSHHTEQISDYLVEFAKKRGLSYIQDDTNNVIITKKASKGYEGAEPIALQGHIDMVLAREPEKKIDLLTEPVTVLEEGDWIFADGTTLGADNGIAVAMMLAVLDDDTLKHPLLECVFTADEEVGLIGASAIDLSGLKSRRLLNLDSESEGVFCAGCAGGADVVCEMPLKRKKKEGQILSVKVSGLIGGHSGSDIHLAGANAIRLLVRALYTVYSEVPFRLVSISGGDANNAIPTNAEAQILFDSEDYDDRILQLIADTGAVLAAEYKFTDPDMRWSAGKEEKDKAESISKKKTMKVLGYLMSLPTGITHLNPVIKGMPQTSLNMGIVRTFSDRLQVEFMVRSGINSQTDYLCDRIACIAAGFGAKTEVRSSYPAWEYRKDSPLRDLSTAVYKELTGKEPVVEVIHAGLECGILSGKIPGLDCISAGPNMQNVHTVRERVSRSSVENVWNFVLALLKKAAEDPQE